MQQRVSELAPIVAVGLVAQAARFNSIQVLRTVGDNKGAMLATMASLLAGVTIAGSVGLTTGNINMIAAGFAISESVSFLSLLGRWLYRTTEHSIENTYNNPSAAELQTWKDYLGSFVFCSAYSKEWKEWGKSFFCYNDANRFSEVDNDNPTINEPPSQRSSLLNCFGLLSNGNAETTHNDTNNTERTKGCFGRLANFFHCPNNGNNENTSLLGGAGYRNNYS
jgi:hypothetical protein